MFFLGQGQGQGNNHFNPDQPRGPDGRWIAEDDDTCTPGPDSPGPGPGNRWRARAVGDDSDIGRAKSIVGYAARELETSLGRFHRVARPDRATAARYARLFRTWDAADDLDDRSFHDRDLGPGIPPAATPWLRHAAKIYRIIEPRQLSRAAARRPRCVCPQRQALRMQWHSQPHGG